jgi:hypothetical protein
MVPESRRVTVRLPAHALAVPARRAPVCDVPADPGARSVVGKRRRPLRPPDARARLAARRDRSRRDARRPRVGRSCPGLGRHALLARPRRRQCVLGARLAGAARGSRAAFAAAICGRAQFDDVQPRARGRTGAGGALRAQARDPRLLCHQLGLLSRPRRRRPARAARRETAGDPGRSPSTGEPATRPRRAAPARLSPDRDCGRLRVRPGEPRRRRSRTLSAGRTPTRAT